MIQYTVEIRPTAENDIARRYQQIAEDSPQNAYSWYFGIIENIQSLSSMPERCPLAVEDAEFNIGIRHLVTGRYRILFFIDKQTVVILHVRHSAMNRTLSGSHF